MSEQRLFEVGKVGVFFDSYSPGVEKRSGEEISVITVKMRVQPFDAKLAAALDDGVGGDSNIKATIFKHSTGEPKQKFTRHDFNLGLTRQNMELFATPDTNASKIALNQARISGTYVRTEKDNNALALVFKATLGPVDRNELEYIHSMHRKQAWVTFHEGQPILDVEEVETDNEENEDAEELGLKNEGAEAPPEGETALETGARRSLHTGRKGKSKRAKK